MSTTRNDGNAKWEVTITQFTDEREWGVRWDWMGFGHLLSIAVNKAPAMRIIVLGCSLWFGRLPVTPKTIKTRMSNEKEKQPVSRTDPHLQFVTLEFKDGTSATFSGPAILFAGDKPKKLHLSRSANRSRYQRIARGDR